MEKFETTFTKMDTKPAKQMAEVLLEMGKLYASTETVCGYFERKSAHYQQEAGKLAEENKRFVEESYKQAVRIEHLEKQLADEHANRVQAESKLLKLKTKR